MLLVKIRGPMIEVRLCHIMEMDNDGNTESKKNMPQENNDTTHVYAL